MASVRTDEREFCFLTAAGVLIVGIDVLVRSPVTNPSRDREASRHQPFCVKEYYTTVWIDDAF